VLDVVPNIVLWLRLLELELDTVLVEEVKLLELDTVEELVIFAGKTHPEIGCDTTLRPDTVPGLTRTISTQKSESVTVMLWEKTVCMLSTLKVEV
jgi:hypothetical protein